MKKLEIKNKAKVVTKTFRLSEDLVCHMSKVAEWHNISLNALTEQMLGYAMKNLQKTK